MQYLDSHALALLNLQAALRAQSPPDPPPQTEALQWLALAPLWPAAVAELGLPSPSGTEFVRGKEASGMLEELEEGGWVDAVEAMPPWPGKVYRMSRPQRRRALQLAQQQSSSPDGGLLDEALRACNVAGPARKQFETPYPQALRHWCELLAPLPGRRRPSTADVGDRLRLAVRDALQRANALGLEGSPEAASLLEAAEPLAAAIGGHLRVAVAACQRELELYHRRVQDRQGLDNYQNRAELDAAIEELVSGERGWALHCVGVGGVGKTMFLRHLQAHLAARFSLATARVDFDHLNPDYPLRSPGLLLLSFAEELRLEAPDAAIDYFAKLALEVSQVHVLLETARREGREVGLGFDAPGFSFCVDVFVEALRAIERGGRQPVLILDTCEELTRLRFDGKLPRALVETFKIVEELHRLLPALRVVFSGRRPLAGKGAGWTWIGEELPEREYMRIRPILGFDADEALGLLRSYHRTEDGRERGVPAQLYAGILELSRSAQAQELARLSFSEPPPGAAQGRPSGPDDAGRHSPYDVALYAGWAAADASLTPETLRRAGRHHYVRERIVARLQEDVREWLPYLAVLGTFDRELVEDLTGLGDGASGLWSEIRQQEWTDVDHGVSTVADQAALTFWHVDPQMRERLKAYYLDERPGTWANARRQVGEVLARATLTRDWPHLTPAYFEIHADVSSERPAQVLAWWRQVEQKILDGAAWEWADRLCLALLEPGGPVKSGRALGTSTHPLFASLNALRANVQMRGFVEDDSLGGAWSEVDHALESHPREDERPLLALRAAAGQVAYLRHRAQPLAASYAHEFQALFERIPPLDPLLGQTDPALVRQAVHTELALLDNAVEALERVEWNERRPVRIVELVRSRAARLAERLGAERWLGPYFQRLNLLAGPLDSAWPWKADWQSAPPAALLARAFDWVPPRDLDTRRLLECGRLIEAGALVQHADEFCEAARQRVRIPTSLDEDRLLSLALRSDGRQPPSAAGESIQASLRVSAQREECQAHRRVPPLFVTAIQALAAAGDVSGALEALQQARASRPGAPVVRWLDATGAYLNRRFRLAEVATGAMSAPELPSTEAGREVGDFLAMTARGLELAQQGQSFQEQLVRAQALAEALCTRLGFTLPASTAGLDAVPPGWRPWFARFLALQTLGQPKVDEAGRAALTNYLQKLYGTDLLDDVAFLGTGGADVAPGGASPSSKELLVGLVVFATVTYAATRAVGWAAQSTSGRDLPWWQDFLVLIALVVAGSALVVMLPRLFSVYARWLGRHLDIRALVSALPEGSHLVEVEFTYLQAIRRLFGWERKATTRTLIIEPSAPYALAAERFTESPSKGSRLSRWMAFAMSQARIRYDIAPGGDEELGPQCWEAVLGAWDGERVAFSSCPFEFRRLGGRAWDAGDAVPWGSTVFSVSAVRELSTWRARLGGGGAFVAQGARALPDGPDRNVRVLMLQAEVSVTESGPRLALEGSSTRTFRPEDLARLFPNLRLLVLLGLDRSEAAPRTATDRLVAAGARRAASELFHLAAPAVIVIPGLPSRTSLADVALEIVADVVAGRPGDALPPLRSAVRRIQDRIFAGAGLAPADASELAYDVCFYCADDVTLRVRPKVDEQLNDGDRAPSPSMERGERA